jgi:DNA mismatch endonuclease (patch repair protein)
MIANKKRDTRLELRVRKRLHADGFRFRVDFAPVDPRRRADIVFTRRRIAVFLDGCFWHGCPLHYAEPRSNRAYWIPKIRRNVQRDLETTARLRDQGWQVLRYWEHADTEEIVEGIEIAARSAGALLSPIRADADRTRRQ